ncbi:MarR family transcriptional regulator [Streptomyces sp. NBC_00234]|uniref:MarR family winged helix-turn-helix transcriptional regulator n=1 Tax=Streptomyces sp. NBC_00234 TaxID=2903638 RepID=UPI002E292614|nr:MarR family transcriptional regulator [Streptomyces sp. NBC_00234]
MGENRTPAVSMTLDDQLCFALYSASRAVTAAYRPVLAELDLTYPQYLVMLALWERTEIPMKELGTVLGMDYGTLSPLLKRLEAAGLLRRERESGDERLLTVSVTEKGAELYGRAARVPGSMGRKYGLTAEAAGQLRELLGELSARLKPESGA